MTWGQWNEMVADADAKWDRAIAVSDAAGNPYNGRGGERVNPEKDTDSIVRRVLLQYAAQMNKPYR